MDEAVALNLRDATLRGWFNNATGELFDGFGAGPEDTVLDAGCGGGDVVAFLAKTGARLIAIDIDAANVAAALANLRRRGRSASRVT